jgi:hypothetical protein
MIITDVDGYRLSLTKTKLIEVDHLSVNPYHAFLSDILKSYVARRITDLRIHGKDAGGSWWGGKIGYPAFIDPKERRIGCRRFSPETFAQILKAAGVKTAKARKKSKRK